MRLIDADALKESLTETLHRCDEWIENAKDEETRTIAESNYTAFLESILRVKDAPTIDAVPREDYEELERHFVNWEPVVRCKDCKWKADTIGESWCDFHEFTILSDDDYCSYGERRNDEID